MKVYLIFLAAAFLVMLCCGPSASANTQQFTFAGSDGDGPVSGTAIVTTSNGKITIQITDLQAGMMSIGQSISELSFGLTGGGSASSATLFSFAGNQIEVNPGGTVTPETAVTGWGVGASGGIITVAASAGGHFENLSNYEILGPPCADGTYCDANGSIEKSAHDALYNGTVTIVLDVTGVTSATSVNNVEMFFGTGPELHLPASLVTPEPASMLLLGTGLVAFGGMLRRRKAAN